MLVPALGAAAYATIVATGFSKPADVGPPLQLQGFLDTAASSSVALRFIHAAPGAGAVDFGTGSGSGFSVLAPGFSNVAFGGRSVGGSLGPDAASPTVDDNGYVALSSLSEKTLTARLHTDAGGVASGVASDGPGSVVTIALVGTSSAPKLVQCVDNAAAAPGAFLGTCSPISN
jgi:hypothetical protein